jgi:hypothetical protein
LLLSLRGGMLHKYYFENSTVVFKVRAPLNGTLAWYLFPDPSLILVNALLLLTVLVLWIIFLSCRRRSSDAGPPAATGS